MITPGRESSAFGALLKAFRTRRRLTQQQLAEAIGMPSSDGSREMCCPRIKRWCCTWTSQRPVGSWKPV